MKKLGILLIALVGFGISSFGQASATASAAASGTIVTPISISKTVDMNFGNIATTTGGSVALSPTGGRTPTGGVTLPGGSRAGTVSAAEFAVTGAANYTYSITLPTSLTITRASGSETMDIGTFTSSPTPTGTLSASGTETLKVGATLTVGASQVAGVYTNATGFDVTVNYN